MAKPRQHESDEPLPDPDDVLRVMLNTPPTHPRGAAKRAKPKPAVKRKKPAK
jgi:hypothetical protein